MSDTDSSEDETSAKLLASVDTSFLSDTLYKSKEPATKENGREKGATSVPPSAPIKSEVPKSNRYLLEEENVWKSDLTVTESMKKHLAAKLSQIIGSMIVFDDVSSALVASAAKKPKKDTEESGVRLLSNARECIQLSQISEAPTKQLKKAPICRRVPDGETEPKHTDKVALSVCSPGSFAEEVRHWKEPKRRSTVYQYTKKGKGACVEKVPPNEFTAARLKNGWDESKIKSFKRKFKNEQQ